MDINKLIARVKAILIAPKTEWPAIDAENTSTADLYKNYILILAAIPAIAGFIKGSVLGYSIPFVGHFRVPIGSGLSSAIVSYALGLVAVYLVALIIDALAPKFGAQKNQQQALKVTAYAWTASWIAGIGLILPGIGWLIALAGGIYAIYLLYLGLPVLMKAPQDRVGGYTAVSIILAIVLMWIIALIVGAMAGTSMGSHALNQLGSSDSNVTIDSDSALGKLAAMGQRMEEASKKMEQAQKSGDSEATGKAIGSMLGAISGSGEVEALAPDALKPFLPQTLAGLPRTKFSAERSAALGMQIAEAEATYSDGNRELQLEISDLGSAKGFLALAGFAAIGSESESDHGYEKTYRQNGRLIQEEWDSSAKRGKFSIILGERFQVELSGSAGSMEELKAAAASIDLGKLEALKNAGVKKG